MAMAVRRCETEHIAQCSMTRASPGATGRRHRATTHSVSPRRPPGRQSTQQLWNMYPLCSPFRWPSRCDGARIDQWRWSRAFIKATTHHHRASTHSDSINRTCQRRLLLWFHCEKGLELTFWPLITIGGMTYQTDEKNLTIFPEYFVGVVKLASN